MHFIRYKGKASHYKGAFPLITPKPRAWKLQILKNTSMCRYFTAKDASGTSRISRRTCPHECADSNPRYDTSQITQPQHCKGTSVHLALSEGPHVSLFKILPRILRELVICEYVAVLNMCFWFLVM